MVIKLYKTASDPKNVTKTLTDELSLTGVCRDPVNYVDPVIEIQGSSSAHMLEGYNYMYIEDFGRYYFINVTPESYDLNIVNGHCDVLMTASAWLKQRSATITRNERLYNSFLSDPDFNAYAYRNIVTKQFPSGITADSIILMTVG